MSSTALTAIKFVCTGKTAHVAPGKEIEVKIPADEIPRYGLVKLMRLADGNYMPVLRTQSQYVRLTGTTGKELGLDLEYRTFLRLFKAGFIKGKRPSPNSTFIDLESLYLHLEATEDPKFWTRERIEDFRCAI